MASTGDWRRVHYNGCLRFSLGSTRLTSAVRITVQGIVQGVGFRPWVQRAARELSLTGLVRNEGSCVTIEAFGSERAIRQLIERIAGHDLPSASVFALEWDDLDAEPPDSFTIAESQLREDGRVSLAPDLASCPECLAELRDPADRRHGYAFTTCTQCGPRFTIARALPYDRERTTMDHFPMCPECGREYAHQSDRRFHAQAHACPRCGPRLRLLRADGRVYAETGDALVRSLELIRQGGIVALQGIGGFHLCCDAANDVAVQELRWRKHRERKPFAVMVPDLDAAAALAKLDLEEEALLKSQEAPIVLARRRRGARLARAIAPGSRRVGLLLPYSPLHHLLLEGFGAPLVMTSGNRTGEPMAYRPREALERLHKIADAFLVHDRDIVAPCDDSVASVISGVPTVLRRSRGFVPRPIRLRQPVREPVLAVGGQMNNTFCIARGDQAWLSQHNGDLDSPEALEAFENGIERMQELLGVRPELVAHDLHPLYESTRYAQGRGCVQRIGVQHHHAHVASVMAEHGLEEPVIGVAYDGTGYGSDGTAWGGEILYADFACFERLSHFRPILLPGGDAAIREVWRSALSLLEDAFAGEPPLEALTCFTRVAPDRLEVVRRMVRTGAACAPAHGVGRYFDALGALVLGRSEADFQGEIALAWNEIASPESAPPYPFGLADTGSGTELDLRPMVRAAVADHLAGCPPPEISRRFHETLGEATAALVAAATLGREDMPVVLSGGCFQNCLLTQAVLDRLADRRVYRHREVPPGDGGIALGQALVAAAVRAREEDAPCA